MTTWELSLNYCGQIVSFDSPDLFEFGEALARHAMFRAESAISWGANYHWAQVSIWLDQLLEQGILHFASPYHDAPVHNFNYFRGHETVSATVPYMNKISVVSQLPQSL
jgi:hypothetical protein